MRFALPRHKTDAADQWSSLGSTLAWLKYQCLVIEHLCNLSSLFWLAAFIYYLKFSIRLENGPVLYVAYGIFVLATLLTIPYLWIARCCLIGTQHKKVGPLVMLWGGHARWRKLWDEQVAIPSNALAELAKSSSEQIRKLEWFAKEQRLRGPELTIATEKQHQALLLLYDQIPHQWTGSSMFYGRLRDDHTPLFQSDNIQRDIRLCLARVVMKTFENFYHVVAYRAGPSNLVLLFDRREGRLETKVRLNISLVDHGGSYQWAFEFATCYFFMPGFVTGSDGITPSEGDLTQVRRELIGNRWTAPLRVGLFAPLNPLNLFRIFNIVSQGFGCFAERSDQVSSIPYFANNYLGGGDFTDLCLINEMRFKAMGEGDRYQGRTISIPTERTEKEAEQFTLSIQQVVQAAIRGVLASGADAEVNKSA